MEKAKKIKILIGLFYVLAVSLFLYFFFSKFSLQEITSYEFIKDNRNYFYDLKQKNLFFLIVVFILFTVVWVFAAGFVAPLALFSGFIFGKWLGLIFLIFGMTIGSTALYIFANYFLKELIRNKFLNRFQNLEQKFKKSEFVYLLLYRFVGGIPFALSNVLPCIFNVKVSNFFWATLFGIIPQLFLIVSLGSGLEEIIDQSDEAPRLIDLAMSPDIFIPVLAFILILILSIILRNKIFKK